MFRLFRRSKVERWELDVLVNVFTLLSDGYISYRRQVEGGLLTGVFFNSKIRPNHVQFFYDGKIARQYENKKCGIFALKGIKVFDIKTGSYIDFEIYLAEGLVTGYSTPHNNTFELDTKRTDIFAVKKIFSRNSDFLEIRKLLTTFEMGLLNKDDVYELNVNGNLYYHLWDLDDGDFIGIDSNKSVYKITHDPLQAELINESLANVSGNLDKYR